MPPSGAALLLASVGQHVARRFAERLQPLDLTPPHVAVLRTIATEPGLNQIMLAARIRTAPSRVVKLLDELTERGLVERRQSASDRRNHELHLSEAATERLARVRRVVTEHDAEIIAPLDADELAALVRTLQKIAEANNLAAGPTPGP
jgi:DNA-binding MarR family transcriptional regulator